MKKKDNGKNKTEEKTKRKTEKVKLEGEMMKQEINREKK